MFLTYLRLAVLGAALWAGPALASQPLEPLPALSKAFDLAAYAAQTDTVKKEFPDIPNVAFEISLPKSWPERIAMGQQYGEIARYDGPPYGDVRPYFSFKRIAVNRENSAKNELIAYMLRQNYILKSIKETDDRNVEALYVMADAQTGDSFVVRTVMRISGADMLLAEYGLPVSAWDQKRDEQTFAIQSFKFLKDSTDTIEKRLERTYFDQLRFHYPASWFFEGEDAPADNRVSIRLVSNEGGAESGRIRVGMTSPRSLKDKEDKRDYKVDMPALLKELKAYYENKGYEVGKSAESIMPDLNMKTAFAVTDVYNLTRRISNYDSPDKKQPVTEELWVTVFRGGGNFPKTYIVELLTPARTQDIYLWSVNSRAYKIIMKSIQ